MYAYDWDEETGGYLLINKQLKFSKEPRPVYYKELDILGFDKYWNYDKDDTYPIMWAESSTYIYRGKKVAKTIGGNVYNKPKIEILEEPEENGEKLKFVDIKEMVSRNKEMLDTVVNKSVKDLYNTYTTYKNKVDLFYIAFSGGKDSIALLDIVMTTIPNKDLRVVFGDTQMEFTDTYDVVEKVKKECEEKGVPFHIAKSNLEVVDSWEKFGAPAHVLRWCCSVHKTSPQIKLLRKVLNKPNFTGMAFIGVRGDESASRSEYEYVTNGKKHKGQYNCNPIFHWNTAELFLYIYTKGLTLNKAYLKGNIRAGCLVCPMSSPKSEYMKSVSYKDDVNKFLNLIEKNNGKDFETKEQLKEYMELGGWKARSNGRELAKRKIKYIEKVENGTLEIQLITPTTNWKKWIETIGELQNDENPYKIKHKGEIYPFVVEETEDGLLVKLKEVYINKNRVFGKLFKQTFKKTAHCESCTACEVQCKKGVLTFKNNELNISNKCTHCSDCHDIPNGCYVYSSIKVPIGGKTQMKNKTINIYSNHGPKEEWLKQYFELEEEFHNNHNLGKNMFSNFRRFLKDSRILSDDKKNDFTKTARYIKEIGRKTDISNGIMAINLAETPQVHWYIKNIKPYEIYTAEKLNEMIEDAGVTRFGVNGTRASITRILETDIGSKVGLGSVEKDGTRLISITRSSWIRPNKLVILYGIYKFAVNNNNCYGFTLNELLKNEKEEAVSPAEIFNIDKQTMKETLIYLSHNYPKYINVHNGVNNITLQNNKEPEDILDLIIEEHRNKRA